MFRKLFRRPRRPVHVGAHRAGRRRPAHDRLQVTGPLPVVDVPPRRRHRLEDRVNAAITPASWWDGGRA